jgi:hypothetical protein
LAGLAKKLDAFVKDNKKANAEAVVVLLGKPDDAAKAKLKKLAKDEKLAIPLTISFDKGATVDVQKLNEKVKTTVLVYKEKKVTANFALDKISDKDVEAVIAAAREAAGAAEKRSG